MNEHTIYRLLSAFNWGKAAAKGPKAVGRRAVRVAAYRGVTKALRKGGF